jgi:predicted flap endonuclease-1-like 5' DNA nuclease
MSIDRSMRTMVAVFFLLAALFVAMNRVVDSAPAADWWFPTALFVIGLGLVLSLRYDFSRTAPEEEPALPTGDIHTYRVTATSTPRLHTMTIRPDPEAYEHTVVTVKEETTPEVLPFMEHHVPPAPVPPEPALIAEAVAAPIPEPAPVPPAAGAPDDLTKIVGIGSKSAAALAAAGIDTFEKLASASREAIHEALDNGNVRLVGDVHTWAQQAAFAARGDWEGVEQAAHTSASSD